MSEADTLEHEAVEAKADDNADDAVLERGLKRFDVNAMPQMEMRAQSLEARRFATIPGAQWEGEFGDPWVNRIRLEHSKIGRGIRKIETDARNTRVVPNFRPAGGPSDDETAETLNGMHRADSARANAQEARDNAFSEALGGGFGAYRLANELEDEYDRDNDKQVINPGILIADADQCVFFDLNSRRYDKRDAGFAWVLTEYTRGAFVEEYGEDSVADWPSIETAKLYQYDWFTPDVVRVAEYYEKQDRKEKLFVFTNALSKAEERYWQSELSDDRKEELLATGWTLKEQRRKRCVIMKWVMSGGEVLSGPTRVAGDRIPIVPVYGQRWFVDGQERWKGHAADRMDPQRLYNASISRIAETAASSAQSVPLFAPEQMTDGIGDIWANMLIDRPAYLPVKPLIDPQTGEVVQAGPVGTLAPAQPSPADAAILQIANQDLIEDDADGADTVKANTSAEAMDIAAMRVDAKSGVYLDNRRQSTQIEGEIYLGMCRDVYPEAGREVETMDEDGGDGKAVLFERYTAADGEPRVRNDFSRGKYKVIASVTEATATRRDKTVKSTLNMAEVALKAGDTELVSACILTAITNSDGEGLTELQQWARRRGLGIGLFVPNEDEKKQMEEAAQQPDPQTELVNAQAAQLEANAEKDKALAGKAVADTGLATVKTMEIASQIGAPVPANDGPMPPRRGNQFGGQSLQ